MHQLDNRFRIILILSKLWMCTAMASYYMINIVTENCKTANIYPSTILIELELFESDCQADAY